MAKNGYTPYLFSPKRRSSSSTINRLFRLGSTPYKLYSEPSKRRRIYNRFNFAARNRQVESCHPFKLSTRTDKKNRSSSGFPLTIQQMLERGCYENIKPSDIPAYNRDFADIETWYAVLRDMTASGLQSGSKACCTMIIDLTSSVRIVWKRIYSSTRRSKGQTASFPLSLNNT